MAAAGTKKRIPYFTSYETVEVSIDPDDLHEGGWHHEDECPAKGPEDEPEPSPMVSLIDAISSLHRQAHPCQASDPAICHEEPCRSLTVNQLRGWGA